MRPAWDHQTFLYTPPVPIIWYMSSLASPILDDYSRSGEKEHFEGLNFGALFQMLGVFTSTMGRNRMKFNLSSHEIRAWARHQNVKSCQISPFAPYTTL